MIDDGARHATLTLLRRSGGLARARLMFNAPCSRVSTAEYLFGKSKTDW